MKRFAMFVVALGLALALNVSSAFAFTFLAGDIFASVSSGNVKHYLADGTYLETLNIGTGGYTTGMAFDETGNLYVTGFSSNTIAKFDKNGSLLGNFATGLSTPESIVFDNSGNMYVGNVNYSNPSTGTIFKYDAGGTLLGKTGPQRVDFIDLKPDQKTMYYTTEGNKIGVVDVSTNTALPDFTNSLNSAFALRILPDGKVLVANGGDVVLLDESGNIIKHYDINGINSWFALNLNPDGNSFWSGDISSGMLYEFDIASGNNTQSINTGAAGYLYGVGVYGEPTQACPDCTNSNAVPEPISLWLLGSGLVGLVAVRKRS